MVLEFDYNDNHPWPDSADGLGPSLVLVAPESLADPDDGINWRPSTGDNGNPGVTDRIPFNGPLTGLLDYALPNAAAQPFFTNHEGELAIAFTQLLGTDDAVVTPESSSNLDSWEPIPSIDFVERRANANVSETFIYRIPQSSPYYLRLRVDQRAP